MVAKLSFIMKRSRTDLETVVGFLTTRVSKINVDNLEKLKRILRFVHCTFKIKDDLERQV